MRHPSAGGAYVYGRDRLGEVWGYLAGWCFVIGKTAACAAMAMTVGNERPAQRKAVLRRKLVQMIADHYVYADARVTRVAYRQVKHRFISERLLVMRPPRRLHSQSTAEHLLKLLTLVSCSNDD